MSRTTDDRIETLLAEARSLLLSGRHRDAEIAFGRVLLLDPGHAEARAGRRQAGQALAEERRGLDALLEEAHRLAAEGDAPSARARLEQVVREGGDRDAALALLDRLDAPNVPGVVVSPGETAGTGAGGAAAAAGARPRTWRRTLSAAWMLTFAVLTAAVVSGWENHVARLTGAPSPSIHQAPPTTHHPAPTAGERALASARARLERGDAEGALAALAAIRPEDPAYPFAVQVRAQAGRELAEQEHR